MKKFIIAALFLLLLVPTAMASLPSDVQILDKPAITKLTDEQLIDTYVDTVVEVQASGSFHTTSGFTPSDYKDYKALIKFRLLLLEEIHNRNIEIPQFDRSL